MLTDRLPLSATPFVGRAEELTEIAALLADPACRLLTLVGPGGIGKTRVALEAARLLTFPNGVYFVPLQPLNSADLIIPAIAEALQFQFYSGGEPQEQLLDYLREKSLLLVLDNFEHLLDGVALVSEMLANAPGLKVLATSREALNLQEEWVYPAKGMRVPDLNVGESLEMYSAVNLFVQSARRMRADFALADEQEGVIRICQLVEGMPLGIELASAWVRTLSCHEIAEEIERSLDILATAMRNIPERHRTMRAALEHSWALLTDREREVFKRLSVFRGGFRKEAAQAVADATLATLSSLVDKSLLRANAHGRYDIHELLRQYGEEQLNAAPEIAEQAHDRHSAYYAEFMRRLEEQLKTPRLREAIAEIDAEIDNMRTAWGWMVEKRKATELQMSGGSLAMFYIWHSRFQEGLDLLKLAADALRPISADEENGVAYGFVLAHQSHFYNDISVRAPETAKALAEESLALMRRFENQEGLLLALARAASARDFLGQNVEAKQAIQEGLTIARESGDLRWIADYMSAMGQVYLFQERDYPEAARWYRQGLAIAEQVGDPLMITFYTLDLGRLAMELGDYTEAKRRYEQTLKQFETLGLVWGIAVSYMGLGKVATVLQDFAEARRYFRQELEIDLRVGTPRWQTDTLVNIMPLLIAQGEQEWAVELLTLIQEHPAIVPFNLETAEKQLAAQQAELPPEVYTAAVERGRARDLEASVKELIAAFSQPVEAAEPRAAVQPLQDSLTERERDILRLIAEGRSNREIADELVLALGTVKWYITEIYGKLGVESRTQAVARARALNLLT